jgi:hypothetical protein
MGTKAGQSPQTEKRANTHTTGSSAIDTKRANIPKAIAPRYVEIAQLIVGFCDEKLDEEYKALCLKALEKLCRKRPSPVAGGRAPTWACGIVYAIGSNNFIFDKSQPLTMTATEIAEWFGISKSTAGNKASEVSRLLKLDYTNAEFQLESMISQNTALWLLNVDGFVVDARHLPREIQELAFHEGLIPYIPADRTE